MLREAENKVKIEGILSEVEIKEGSFKKDGKDVPYISGVIKVRVQQQINGTDTTLEIPVHMYASEKTRTGNVNPAYTSIKKVKDEFTSIAASGSADTADCIRITNGKITMNEYTGQDGRLISYPRISASFVNKIKRDELSPEASFSVELVVADMKKETDASGVETGRFLVTGIIPQYGGRVDVVPFVAYNENVINAVSRYWAVDKTVSAIGKLNFSSTTQETLKEVDFGEPQKEYKTVSVSDLVITGGSSTPLDGDAAFDIGEISTALTDRKNRLAASAQKNAQKQTAKPTLSASNLGF